MSARPPLRRRFLAGAAVAAVTCLALTACTSNDPEESTTTPMTPPR